MELRPHERKHSAAVWPERQSSQLINYLLSSAVWLMSFYLVIPFHFESSRSVYWHTAETATADDVFRVQILCCAVCQLGVRRTRR